MNRLFPFLLILILLPIPVSASCLSTTQEDLLLAIASDANVSGSTFLSIFDNFCNHSYPKNESYTRSEIDSKILATENRIDSYNSTIDTKINNLTGWVTEQIALTQVLSDMAEVINASNRMDELETRFDSKILELEDMFDIKLKDLREGFITEKNFDSWKANMTAAFIASQPKADYTSWYFWAAIGAIAVIFLVYKFKGKPQMRGALYKKIKGKSGVYGQERMSYAKSAKKLQPTPEQAKMLDDMKELLDKYGKK